jgi:sigma54-dependent transcription regulator
MALPSECEARHHRCEVRVNAMLGDKVLSAVSGKAKGLLQTGTNLIAGDLGTTLPGFLFFGHVSALPIDERMKRMGGD